MTENSVIIDMGYDKDDDDIDDCPTDETFVHERVDELYESMSGIMQSLRLENALLSRDIGRLKNHIDYLETEHVKTMRLVDEKISRLENQIILLRSILFKPVPDLIKSKSL